MKFNQRKLNNIIEQKGKEIISVGTYTFTCPHCKAAVVSKPGKFACPTCGKEIDLSLNIRTIH